LNGRKENCPSCPLERKEATTAIKKHLIFGKKRSILRKKTKKAFIKRGKNLRGNPGQELMGEKKKSFGEKGKGASPLQEEIGKKA